MKHHTTHSTSRTLRTAIFMSIAVVIIEVAGGIYTGSLALLSDASHAFSDLLALTITLFALRIAARPPTAKHTFGYHRAEVIGALLNGLLLLVMAWGIGSAAWSRLESPPDIQGELVALIGFVGIIPNIWTVARLRKSTNLNVKSAALHALGDAGASVVVVISGVIIALTGLTQFDAAASLIVVALLTIGAIRLLKQVLIILLEGTPENIDRENISKLVCALPGVRSTHDVHLWTLCSDVVYFTGHLVIDGKPDLKKAQEVVTGATRALNKKGVHHITLQIETPDHSCVKEEACEIVH
ncbi:cation transporter [Candidatus Uhrbacteria bacterium]|nr:cation transporter [Candidatus Uhrbacteria bacterium]